MTMDAINLSDRDRGILLELTHELRRFNAFKERESGERLFSIQEAADYMGVTRQTVSAMIRENRLHKVERKKRRGILKSEIDGK